MACSKKKCSWVELLNILLIRSSFYVSSLGDSWEWQTRPWELGDVDVQRSQLQKLRHCAPKTPIRQPKMSIRQSDSKLMQHLVETGSGNREAFVMAPNKFSRLLNKGAYSHCPLLGFGIAMLAEPCQQSHIPDAQTELQAEEQGWDTITQI